MNNFYRITRKVLHLVRCPYYIRALTRGTAAAIEHEPILKQLGAGIIDDVVDIGANIGQFSLVCRKRLPQAKIFAFEPLLEPARRFKAVFRGDQRTKIFQVAVGPVSQKIEMYISKSIDSSSLLPIGDAQSKIFPGTELSHKEVVYVEPLTSYISNNMLSKYSLLKIDVQGYELEVLRGCQELLNLFVAVYVECSFIRLYQGQPLAYEVISWLDLQGFSLECIGAVTYHKNGLSIQGDFLFLRKGFGSNFMSSLSNSKMVVSKSKNSSSS